MSDPHRALTRALRAMLPALVIETSGSRPWASVTFTGARHWFECSVETGDAAWVEAIGEAEFALPGHMVAEIVPERIAENESVLRLRLEALTIEEG